MKARKNVMKAAKDPLRCIFLSFEIVDYITVLSIVTSIALKFIFVLIDVLSHEEKNCSIIAQDTTLCC
jgi:hypothetical protein